MPDQNEYNEMRTLAGELDDLRAEYLAERIRFRNAKMQHDEEVARLNARLSEAQRQVERVVAESAKRPSVQEEALRIAAERERRRVGGVGAAATRMTTNVALGPDYFYASQHHKDVRPLEHLAMVTGSAALRDVLARSATHLLLDYKDLMAVVRGWRRGLVDDTSARVFRTWTTRSLLSLARVVADQRFVQSDEADAIDLYRFAVHLWGPRGLDQRSSLIMLELLDETGQREELLRLASATGVAESHPVQMALLDANATTRQSGTTGGWLSPLNATLLEAGFDPIQVVDGGGDVLSRLVVEDTKSIDEGPLVSVLMASHNGSAHIGTAMRSVLNQTWRNLELIVVDDCSDSGHWAEIERLAAQDSRVTALRQPTNQGAYRARRRALEEARGEFVTVHDDDDWSHPQKIEAQVRALIDEPAHVANMSYMVRINGEGYFLRINDNPLLNQRNYSSLMIRKRDLVRLGGWDDLHRAADAEFHDRLRALLGPKIGTVESPPLSFGRQRTGSLTAGEIRRGALDFRRQTYGLFFRSWHDSLRAAGDPDGATAFAATPRPFPVPRDLDPDSRNEVLDAFDVVFCSELRFPGGNSTLLAMEIEACVQAGLKTAVMHVPSPVLRAPRGANDKIATAVMRHGVPVVSVEDGFETRLLVVRNPSVAQYLDRLSSRADVARVALVANNAPMSHNGRDYVYDIDTARENTARTFSAPCEVFPESPHLRGMLTAVSDTPLATEEWTGFVFADEIAADAKTTRAGLPRIGRHSRDHRLKWPDDPQDIRAAYVSSSFSTTVLGGADTIRDIVDLEAAGVRVHAFGEVTPKEFLRDVDFWVYVHSDALLESFGMAVLEAMSAGCVVLLPPYMEPLFGDGAIYVRPTDVASTVAELWADGGRYRAQSQAAIDTVRERFSSDSYLARIEGLLATVRRP